MKKGWNHSFYHITKAAGLGKEDRFETSPIYYIFRRNRALAKDEVLYEFAQKSINKREV